MIQRGQIYWVDLGEPSGSRPARQHPVLIVQADPYNVSRLATLIAVILTRNLRLAAMPGNVLLPKEAAGLPADSVVNVTAMVTLNKADCRQVAGTVPAHLMSSVDKGLRSVMGL